MGLLDSDGRWQDDPGNIDGIILEYFGSIFKSNEPADFEASLSVIHPKVTLTMNATLTANFRVKEVWNALQQMHPTKSPIPNGMSPIFYQKYWDVVGTNVIDCVLHTLNTRVMPPGLNETFICLTPKVKSP